MSFKPRLTGTTHTLQFEKLSPLDFERLCLWLVSREGYERAEHLGEAGNEGGRDVVAWRNGRRVVFQCKRVKAFTAAHAKAEIEKLRRLPVEAQPQELVFVVSQAVSAETRQAARAAWGDEASCQFWAGSELDERVKRHGELLEEFFQLPAEGHRSAWSWGVGVSILGVLLTVAAWLWPVAPGAAEVQKMLLVARDTKESPLGGFQFAYEGGKSPPTSDTGAAELKLPPKHAPGQKIKILLLSAPENEADWFLINPLVNIPVPFISAEVVLMRRGEFRAFAAEARDASSRAEAVQSEAGVEEQRTALLEVATHHGLTAEQLDSAIRSFGDTQNAMDKADAASLAGQYAKAEKLLIEAAGKDDDNLVETWRRLGWVQYKQAKFSAAAATFRKAVILRERDTYLLSWLGKSLWRLAAYAEAEAVMREALAIDEATLEPDHLDTVRDLNNLAQVLQESGRLAEAEPLMRRALAIAQKILGPQNLAISTQLNNLAALLLHTKRFAEAEPLLRRALAIDAACCGMEHPRVLSRLNNLAQLLQDTGRPDEAEQLMRQVLAISEKSFGKNHPDHATFLSNLAMLLQSRDRRAEAEELMRRVVAIDEASLAPEHPSRATHLNNLAQLLQDSGRLEEAEPLMRRVVVHFERQLGETHPKVAIALNNLATLLQESDRAAEAEPLARRALGLLYEFSHRTSHEHPNFQAVLANYRSLSRKMGKSDAEIEAAVEEMKHSSASPSADS